jgi:hypothetical protein
MVDDSNNFTSTASLWAKAPANHPHLGGDRQARHRDNASRAAALAAGRAVSHSGIEGRPGIGRTSLRCIPVVTALAYAFLFVNPTTLGGIPYPFTSRG